jgi:hypothetical protein
VACNYKHLTIVKNYNYSIANKFGASLTDDARVTIYNRSMFIVQAIEACTLKHFKTLMEQHTLKNVNNYLNTNIYLETSDG